jgi:dipeptidase E
MARAGRTALDLDGVDVIAIPGGNTFNLAHMLRADGLFPLLSSFLERGGGVYGGSAGAVLMGADIGIASIADSNDVGLEETSGLDLVGGLDVLPHYRRELHGVARAHHRDSGHGLLCLPEPSGVIIVGGKARNVGPAAVHVVTGSSSVTYGPGDSWNTIPRQAVR